MSEKRTTESELHAGHRQRMYEKLGKGVLEPHELLEVLLFHSLPRINTNEIAHSLISAFGSLPKVFEADAKQLTSVKGVGRTTANDLKLFGELLATYVREKGGQEVYPDLFSADTFPLFLLSYYSEFEYEVFDFYCLDGQKRIIYRESYSSAESGRAKLRTWQFVDLLRTHKPVGVIVVHNHPKGSCTPSEKDDKTTEELQSICELAGAILCDHYICSKEGVYSYYSAKRLKHEFTVESNSKRAVTEISLFSD